MPRSSLMKRLSKSATDLSPCRRKSRTNSDEDEYQAQAESRTEPEVSDDDCEYRGVSNENSSSFPAISLIGRGSLSRSCSRRSTRTRSRSHHREDRRQAQDRSIAAEIEAVQKSSNFSIFGLLKQKLRVRSKDRIDKSKSQTKAFVDDDPVVSQSANQSKDLNYSANQGRDTPPEIIRIRYDCDGNPNHTGGDNNSTTSEANRKPEVIRKVIESETPSRPDSPVIIRNRAPDSPYPSRIKAFVDTDASCDANKDDKIDTVKSDSTRDSDIALSDFGSFRDSKSKLENQPSIDSCSNPTATTTSGQGAAGSQTAAARSSTPQPSIPFFRSSSDAKHPNFRQDSGSSFLSLLSKSKGETMDDLSLSSTPPPPLPRDEQLTKSDSFHSAHELQEFSKYNVIAHLKQGVNLPAKDSCGTSDPYIKFIQSGKQVHKSRTINKDLNPVWDEHFILILDDIVPPLVLKVYDYDWGLRDDFIGQASIQLQHFPLDETQHVVVNLQNLGETLEVQGQVHLSIRMVPVLPDAGPISTTAASLLQQTSFSASPVRDLQMAARKLKPGTWASIVNIYLIEGKDLLAMDLEGTSDPYCKVRLGSDRYKSKTIPYTLNPVWNEEFELYCYDDQELEITVWDKDQRSKDDYMGKCIINLGKLANEESHDLHLPLQEGTGELHLILSISGTTGFDEPSFLGNYNPQHQATVDMLSERYSFKNSLYDIDDVGYLVLKVFQGRGLVAADLGGGSDPFCVIEVDNTRVMTQTDYKTLDPVWNKVFHLPVKDIHSVLQITVMDEDKNHKSEFLGRLNIPLLKMKNGEKSWFALKDKKLRCRAKGLSPQIQLEFYFTWNSFRSVFATLHPKHHVYKRSTDKFKRQVFINNVMRIKAIILEIVNFGVFINSCLEWEHKGRSIIAFVSFMTLTYYFEPYMITAALLLIFFKQYFITVYREPRHLEREDSYFSEEDEDGEENDGEKEEKKSIKEKLQAVQDVTAMVQRGLGYAASIAEEVKNTFNFSVPFLSKLAIVLIALLTVGLYFVPPRAIVLLWGLNKFTRKLIRPNSVPNNELMDFLSRVPDDVMLIDARELSLEQDTSGKKMPAKKKAKQS